MDTKIRTLVAMAWGASIGSLTFAVGSISVLSPNPIVSTTQVVLMSLILPGIIGGGAIAGNVHAFFLGGGAVINSLFHFGVSWFLIPLLTRSKKGFLDKCGAAGRSGGKKREPSKSIPPH
jgi:hypothetical protein